MKLNKNGNNIYAEKAQYMISYLINITLTGP